MNSNEYEYMNQNGSAGNAAATPVMPLSTPAENGSVYPGNMDNDSNHSGSTNGGNGSAGGMINGNVAAGNGNGNADGVMGGTVSQPGIQMISGENSSVYPGNIDNGSANGGNGSAGGMTGGNASPTNGNITGNGNGIQNGSGNDDGRNLVIGGTINLPLIPLPNPGEGGPAFTGNNSSGIQGTIITVLPRPVTPCFYCNSNSYGTIRFLNTAVGYSPFVVSVNNRTVVDTLEYGEISEYGRTSSGYQKITVAGRNGYIYISKQVRVTVGSTMTIAIVNTAGGLDFVEINDAVCFTPLGGSCLRACNLSYNAGPLTLSTYSGNIVFQNVNFMEVTNYVRVVPAHYDIYVSNRNEALLSTDITVRSGSQYTVYMFNWTESPTAIRVLIIEDRK